MSCLAEFVDRHPRLFVLTGAGLSTGSGIPDYRDDAGAWKRRQPVLLADFVADAAARQRYWARSMIGWPRFAAAAPNAGHAALAELERRGRLEALVTQNVDGLHRRAGSRNVIELHGRNDTVACMACGRRSPRAAVHERLAVANAWVLEHEAALAPDGDADLEGIDCTGIVVPSCACGGLLKPDVVFFGESVPKPRVQAALAALERADALLIVGSSVMVYSSFRFCRRARSLGLPLAAVNRGVTRADDYLEFRLSGDCAALLAAAAGQQRDARPLDASPLPSR